MTTNQEIQNRCYKLSKRNNSILYKIENYFDIRMSESEELSEIRNDVLTVSAEINRLADEIGEE